MKKFIFSFLIVISFSACGVDTASSSKDVEVIIIEEPKVVIPTDSDLIVFDSINSNPVVSMPSDINDSTNIDDPGVVVTPDIPVVNPSISEFDVDGAIEDKNACTSSGFADPVLDASYGGEEIWENGASSSIAVKNLGGELVSVGLVIRSEYVSQDYENTLVTMYYRSPPSTLDLDVQGVANYKMDGVFFISYDLAWVDESLPNVDNVIYVKSKKTLKPSCYRLTLNSVVGNEINIQKVYRTRL